MKVGIVTFHFVNNFGGALQAYALKTACEELGAEAHLVDYHQWFIRFTDAVRMFPIAKNPQVIISGFRTMGQRLGRRRKFSAFHKDYLSLSRKYSCSRAIENHPPGYDKYICGSDQIWNSFITCGLSRAYFLTFEKDTANKFAYAPSFGSADISVKMSKRMARLIKMLGAVSVRESEGVDIVEKMTGKRPPQLIDPSFLISTEKWEKLSEASCYEKPFNEYILVYIMQKDDTVYEYARRLRERYGLPVVEIGRYGYRAHFVDECIVDLGPLEFVSLFRNATHVCTNSYHGIIFSIVFNKKLCIIPCKRFTSRIDSLLKLVGIDLPDDRDALELDVSYDRESALKHISEERDKAIDYLNENLGK